jgi:hypothetical protein
VIVPVYIPNLEGYFQSAVEVLRLCLESLRVTTSNRASVTIVSNGCVPEAVEEMERHLDWADQLILNGRNRGKIDAVVTVAKGAFEPLITVTDCDVLFRQGWVEAVEDIFRVFPEAGYVCPFPSPAGAWHHTSATTLGALARAELRYEKVVDDLDLDRFAHSIGRPDLFTAEHKNGQWIARRNGAVACVGAGHFTCTLRRETLAGMPDGPSLQAIEGLSELRWLDLPPDLLGLWRLSTPKAWVNHMGNVPEDWMREELTALLETGPEEPNLERVIPPPRRSWTRHIPITVRRKMARLTELMGKRASRPGARTSARAERRSGSLEGNERHS